MWYTFHDGLCHYRTAPLFVRYSTLTSGAVYHKKNNSNKHAPPLITGNRANGQQNTGCLPHGTILLIAAYSTFATADQHKTIERARHYSLLIFQETRMVTSLLLPDPH